MPQSDESAMNRVLTLELVRVTERAAIAAAALRGRGDEREADQAAVAAMRAEFDLLQIRGRVVVGEGDRDEASVLFNGEEVGSGEGPEVDIAVDPLEGTNLCATGSPNAIAVLAAANKGGLLHAPDCYMEKIAIGPGYPDGLVDLDMPPDEAIRRIAKAKGVKPGEVSACVLDRPRHGGMIEAIRSTGASIRLIGDGDLAGVIHTTNPAKTGIDIYLGVGGAPEGVLAAAALRCIGGQMFGRLVLDSEEKRKRAEAMGIDRRHTYRTEEMASGDVLFAATGVTDGSLMDGVRSDNGSVTTHSIVTRSHTRTQRWVTAIHRVLDKVS
jgi:fructose-1,6-bisphosphatase II / sedoheptulose-1,7-bisphosphatase